jgi:2-amino-4-hydroxy-6-hydroxymethyldihydropteridine diphosphokinase
MSSHRAYVGIGTNLGDRERNVELALAALHDLGNIAALSTLYRTAPWGKTDQPWFLNGVVALETQRAPRELLDALTAIERSLGRTAGERWGPRVIDLDLLLYDDLAIDEPNLQVPHPHLRERAFILVPLAELDERFGAQRDALEESQLAGVTPYSRPRYAPVPRESVLPMPENGLGPLAARIEALAEFLAGGDAVRVRITRGDEEVEIVRSEPGAVQGALGAYAQAEGAPQRVDSINADLVGIFHIARPAPIEGETFEADRELGYIEALGIRTAVHPMGAGRLLSIAALDGAPVEYGQPLFLVARG